MPRDKKNILEIIKDGRIAAEDLNETSLKKNILGHFSVIEKMIERDRLSELKIWTNKLEAKYGERVDDFVFRKINLDPGILSLANLVLASTKDFSHRIYLRDGIFSEITLLYEKKMFKPLPWTYPDYTEPKVIDFLKGVRDTMKRMEYEE